MLIIRKFSLLEIAIKALVLCVDMTGIHPFDP